MSSRILVSIRVAATPERAFAVFTEEIGDWWVANDLFRFTPGAPGRLAFDIPEDENEPARLVEHRPGGEPFEIGRVSVWEPAERVVVAWRQISFGPEHDTEVEVSFAPVGEFTRVTVEHRGWERIPQDHVARHSFPLNIFLTRHGEYWRALLSRFAGNITDSS